MASAWVCSSLAVAIPLASQTYLWDMLVTLAYLLALGTVVASYYRFVSKLGYPLTWVILMMKARTFPNGVPSEIP
jgi:hypothetical protein